MRRASCLVIALLSLTALTTPALRADITVDVGRGPVVVHVPASYDPSVPAPLLLLLHAYALYGDWIEAYYGIEPAAEAEGFVYCAPDGSRDSRGISYWNATDACCDFEGAAPDDSGYLRALVEEIQRQLNIDERRIYSTGHSNGGFMCHRLACDHADLFAAVASLAGATYDDESACTPSEPVHVLAIHGTDDGAVLYDGGFMRGVKYPGARKTVRTWASYDGCRMRRFEGYPDLDLVISLDGPDTTVEKWLRRCSAGGSGELWSIVGGQHSPGWRDEFAPRLLRWFLDHPKPGPWDDEGGGVAGVHGVPLLVGTGAEVPGDRVTLRLTDGLAGAPGFLVVGATELAAPFAGGTLVPQPDWIPVLVPGFDGSRVVSATWPPGVPSGSSLWYQVWLFDPTGVQGLAASRGLESRTR